MILNCPSCSAKFMISSEALGPDGREVRCGKCGHMWFQPGERDSLDDLPDLGTETVSSFQAPSDDDIGFQTHVPEQEEQPKAKTGKKKTKSDVKIIKAGSKKLRHITAVILVGLIIGALCAGLILSRNSIGYSVHFMGAAYDALGLPLEKVEPQVSLEHVKLARKEKRVTGEGYITNLLSEEVPIDYITLDLLDLSNKILKTADIKMTTKTLKAKKSEKIEFYFDDVPKEAVAVRIHLQQ